MGFGFRFNSSLPSCTGIEVKLFQDGSMELRMLSLSVDKKMIHINSKKAKKCTLETLANDITAPTALTLTGRGVLMKKTKRIEKLTNVAVQDLFPGLEFSEFYVQNFISGDCSFVSLIRTETLNVILHALGKSRNYIMTISLGAFVIDHIIPQLNVYSQNLRFDGHLINLNSNRTWNEYTPNVTIESSFELKVDIETIEEQYLLAYATAFQLILNDSLDPVQLNLEDVELNKIEFFAKLVFEKRTTITILVFLALLLSNFFLFTYYKLENENNTGIAGQRFELVLGKKKMESEISDKELLVEKLRWNNGLSYAFICDQMGLIAPNSITLKELSVNIPGGKDVSKVEPGIRQMKVLGQAEDVYGVNQFIYACKNRKWIKQVRLEKFTADEQNSTQVFSIIITY